MGRLVTEAVSAIREWRKVDLATFRDEIVPAGQPALMKGLFGNWPAVQAGLKSAQALCDYMNRFDAGGNVQVISGPPSIKGRFFYKEDLSGLNFERAQVPFRAAIERLLVHLDDPSPPAIAIQATSVTDHLPGFARENVNALLDETVGPRIWVGNAATVATHFDPLQNIACVVAGRRRFTLFPPDQVSNLYIGPFEMTPAGAPVSMASVAAPDFERYPRFKEALAAAQTADLEPGDAVYIPYLWWHNVESLEKFNVLVNYWWNPAPADLGRPFYCIFHGMMTFGALPEDQRKAWRAMFDHYVFKMGPEPGAHLPPEKRGVLSPMTRELAMRMKATLLDALKNS